MRKPEPTFASVIVTLLVLIAFINIVYRIIVS